MKRKGWGFPLLLGVATMVLLTLALWPEEEKTAVVVVAARDLGAGTVLQAADLKTLVVNIDQVPDDALAESLPLIGETLSVVRFANEPVTTRHMGQAVTLAADERGIAVQVQADTGLAGLLRPGMEVGLVATLRPAPSRQLDSALASGDIYAKALLEGLRVLYVPPEFQARPFTPISAQMTVENGTASAPVSSAPSQPLRDSVIVLAASTEPQALVYTMPLDETLVEQDEEWAAFLDEANAAAVAAGESIEPPTREFVPVELLAALNAADASFTLVLMPDSPEAYTTTGLDVGSLVVQEEEFETEVVQ